MARRPPSRYGGASRTWWAAGPEADAIDVHGGMSPGPAVVLPFASGERVFVKALAESVSPPTYYWYRQEVAALKVPLAGVPAPRFRGVAEVDDWLAVVTGYVPGVVAGHRGRTSRSGSSRRRASGPPPTRRRSVDRPFKDKVTNLDGWVELASGPVAELDEREYHHAQQLAQLTADWRDWTVGSVICHDDLVGTSLPCERGNHGWWRRQIPPTWTRNATGRARSAGW